MTAYPIISAYLHKIKYLTAHRKKVTLVTASLGKYKEGCVYGGITIHP